MGPFKVLERVGRLAYHLDIPAIWNVYPVFTIAQLEPCPDPNSDPYIRSQPRPNEPPPVFVEGDTDEYKSWELDRIINKRVIAKGRGFATEYLIKWKGYGPEHDKWRNVKELGNAQDLIQDYENARQSSESTSTTSPGSDPTSRRQETRSQKLRTSIKKSLPARKPKNQANIPEGPGGNPKIPGTERALIRVEIPVPAESSA